MADIPHVEQQSSGQVLKERKLTVTAAQKELISCKEVLQYVAGLLKQNRFYEKEIDAARGRIFMLLVAQTRNAEVARSEDYIAQLGAALDALSAEEKKAKKE